MVRAFVLIGGAVALFACANRALDDVGGGGGAAETPQALDAAGVGNGLYVIEDVTPPTGAYLRALEVQDATHARLLFSYPGSGARVEGACIATASVRGGSAKTLALRCAASPFEFKLASSAAGALALENGKGERFALGKIDPNARGAVHATCEAAAFSVTLDVTGAGAARRTVVRIQPKVTTTPDTSAPPRETFVLAGEHEQRGRDLVADEYDLTLPSTLAKRFDAELGFVNVMTPFALHRASHALSCEVDS